MATIRVCLLLAALQAAAATAALASNMEATGVSPLQKVVMMLNDMMNKAKVEKQDEQVRFASYKQFCESTTAEKKRSIAEGKEEVEQLKADVSKADADVMELSKAIS